MADILLKKQPARGPGRPFQKGQSGNPAGRPRGSRNTTSLLLEQLLDGQAEALLERLLERALAGDVAAIRFCLQRLLPAPRERIELDLPMNEAGIDVAASADTILAATASGEIAPDAGKALADLIKLRMAVDETTDLRQRIEELERAAERWREKREETKT